MEMEAKRPDLRNDFIQHQMDFNFLSKILDEKIDNEDIKEEMLQNHSFQILRRAA